MKPGIIALFLGAGLAALAAGHFAARWLNGAGPTIGVSFEAPALPDSSGALRDPGEWQGSPLLVNFWATWCTPCREEIPLLVDAVGQYGPQGLKVLGVAVDDGDAVAGFEQEFAMNYPSLVGQTEGMALLQRYGGGSGLPFTLAVDADGAVRGHKLGRISASEIERLATAALSGQ